MAGSVRVSVTVNGAPQSAEVEPRLLLVHFLRETLGLTGTHVGCDRKARCIRCKRRSGSTTGCSAATAPPG